MVLSGSQEGQGSSTFLQARQIWRWQAEEEGYCFLLIKVVIFFPSICRYVNWATPDMSCDVDVNVSFDFVF